MERESRALDNHYRDQENGVSNAPRRHCPLTDPTISLEITLNGEKTAVPAGCNVLELLSFLHVEPSRVAVEINRQIARKETWPETRLSAGDSVEVVHFVGGGRF